MSLPSILRGGAAFGFALSALLLVAPGCDDGGGKSGDQMKTIPPEQQQKNQDMIRDFQKNSAAPQKGVPKEKSK